MQIQFEKKQVHLEFGKKIYFASDFHLGVPDKTNSRKREQKIVTWLSVIESDAQAVFLVGDIFDFWFEYKTVIPKGFVRLLGKLADMVDRGIEVIIFTGNHDMWMCDYLTEEIGAQIYRNPVQFEITDVNNSTKKLLVGHGDGLGPGDTTYKFLKKIFENKFFQSVFRFVHPDIGIWIASEWSKRSRVANINKGEEIFMGEEREWLFVYCKEIEAIQHHDYYIFGHRHFVLDLAVAQNSRYINLGEWVSQFHFATFDGKEINLKEFIA